MSGPRQYHCPKCKQTWFEDQKCICTCQPEQPITTELSKRFEESYRPSCPQCGSPLPVGVLLDFMAQQNRERVRLALAMRDKLEVTVDEKLMLSGAGMPKSMEPSHE